MYRDDDDLRTLKSKTRDAIQLAMEGRWDDAAAVNRELLALSTDSLDACNRLGKALLELGDTKGARGAFEHSLRIAPTNAIARKNVDRLAGGVHGARPAGAQLAPKMFIGDAGKSAQVALLACASDRDRPFISPGVPLELRCHRGTLAAYSQDGGYIGLVPPKIGRRLVCMMEAGNRYEAAVASSTAEVVRVVLRESYQHPSQRSKLSFPSAAALDPAAAPRPQQAVAVPAAEHELAPGWADDERED